ncbi:hypothetical protein B0H21DRAFT_278265 [Amylocystis lapponica]|nr:hypothetical protein B0H21DRAFT_278265 [Amylocystis lapponica]
MWHIGRAKGVHKVGDGGELGWAASGAVGMVAVARNEWNGSMSKFYAPCGQHCDSLAAALRPFIGPRLMGRSDWAVPLGLFEDRALRQVASITISQEALIRRHGKSPPRATRLTCPINLSRLPPLPLPFSSPPSFVFSIFESSRVRLPFVHSGTHSLIENFATNSSGRLHCALVRPSSTTSAPRRYLSIKLAFSFYYNGRLRFPDWHCRSFRRLCLRTPDSRQFFWKRSCRLCS